MSADFSFDEFNFNEGVFEDFLKDLDADQKAQGPVDMTFQSFDLPTPEASNKARTNNITTKPNSSNNAEQESYDASALMAEQEQLMQVNNLSNSNNNNNMQFYNPRATMPIPMPMQIPTTGFEPGYPPHMPHYYHPSSYLPYHPSVPTTSPIPEGSFYNQYHLYPHQPQPHHHYMATGHISPPLPTNLDENLLRQIQQDDEREKQMFAALDVDEAILAATPKSLQTTRDEKTTSNNGITYPPNPLPMSRDVSEISIISQLSSQSNQSASNNPHKRKSLPRSPIAHYQPPPSTNSNANSNSFNSIPMVYPMDNGMMYGQQQYYTGTDGQLYPNPFYLSNLDMQQPPLLYPPHPAFIPYDGFTQAAHKIQRVSHPLLNFPQSLFDAFNGGDLKKVKKLVHETTNKDCLLMTPALTYSAQKVIPELKPLNDNNNNNNNNQNFDDHSHKAFVQGEKYVEDFFDAMSEMHPDAVWIAKKVRYEPPHPVILPTVNYHKMKPHTAQPPLNKDSNPIQEEVSHPEKTSSSTDTNNDGSGEAMGSIPLLTLQMPSTNLPDNNNSSNNNNNNNNQVKLYSSITCRVYFAGTRVAPNLAMVDPLLETNSTSDTEYLFHYRGHFLIDELENKHLLTPPEVHALHELERNCPSLAVFGKGTMTLYMQEEEEKIAMWDIQWKLTSFRASDP